MLFRSETTRFFSSVAGREIDPFDIDTTYWIENLVSPVRFAEAMHVLLATRTKSSNLPIANIIIEIGPHAALSFPIKQLLQELGESSPDVHYLSTLQKGKDGFRGISRLVAALYDAGANVDLVSYMQVTNPRTGKLLSNLPAYPWNHSRSYWHDSRLAHAFERSKIGRAHV